MSESAYRLEETTADAKWDEFIHKSPVGTIFSLSDYLEAVGHRTRLFWCLRGIERRAAVVINEDEEGRAVLDDFVIHNGLIFGPRANKQNRSQMISERFEIAVDVAAELSRRYPHLEMALSPQIDDVRPFLWHNYGEDNAPTYTVDVRYTAYADLTGFAEATAPEEIPLFNEVSYARRQEVRKGIKAGLVTTEDMDGAALAAFYDMTMRRQNIETAQDKLDDLCRYTDQLLSKNMARLFVSRTTEGEPAALALFGWDTKRAYYLFGAGDPVHRNTPCGTTVLWDGFTALAKAGHREVDLEGVNSPRRGWFKLSFGAELRTYYQLTKMGEEAPLPEVCPTEAAQQEKPE